MSTPIVLYHYASRKKYENIIREGFLRPTAPFNSTILDKDWEKYIKQFTFPVFKFYVCTFFEPQPRGWIECGLFDLLMEEFASGECLLKITTNDSTISPIIVREHAYHSPKMYGYPPHVWQRREVRNSRPDLRELWYNSAVPLSQYEGDYCCPEVLFPFEIPTSSVEPI